MKVDEHGNKRPTHERILKAAFWMLYALSRAAFFV